MRGEFGAPSRARPSRLCACARQACSRRATARARRARSRPHRMPAEASWAWAVRRVTIRLQSVTFSAKSARNARAFALLSGRLRRTRCSFRATSARAPTGCACSCSTRRCTRYRRRGSCALLSQKGASASGRSAMSPPRCSRRSCARRTPRSLPVAPGAGLLPRARGRRGEAVQGSCQRASCMCDPRPMVSRVLCVSLAVCVRRSFSEFEQEGRALFADARLRARDR